MSEPQAHEEVAEKLPRTSVHELPKLPVEFPPKDSDTEISGEFVPKKSVTFEVTIDRDVEPSLPEVNSSIYRGALTLYVQSLYVKLKN